MIDIKRAMLLLLTVVTTATVSATQLTVSEKNYKKLSVTTKMFIDEMNSLQSAGDNGTGARTRHRAPSGNAMDGALVGHKENQRMYVSPDTINGRVYISSFIELHDNGDLDSLKALGVDVQRCFKQELVTANIPVEKLDEVADIWNVKQICVSPLMKPETHVSRHVTGTDFVLSHQLSAAGEQLAKKYDGTGVLLGVIDLGIDFHHIAFKDKDGNSRIKGAYLYGGNDRLYRFMSDGTNSIDPEIFTTDSYTDDHGTHTASTAGGSSVIIGKDNSVTVTDDHAHATYGGMAPGADLYLAGIYDLSETNIFNAVYDMYDYANDHGMSLVVSNSWGTEFYAHDGNTHLAELFEWAFNNPDYPNHIAVVASGNNAGNAREGEGGGCHILATASKSKPLGSVVRQIVYANADAGAFYQGYIANVWTRTPVDSVVVNVYVLDAITGEVLSNSVTNSNKGAWLCGDAQKFYEGDLLLWINHNAKGQAQVVLYTFDGLKTKDYEFTDGYVKDKYTLAMEIYPTDGSEALVDIWGFTRSYFTDRYVTTEGHTWVAGDDDMSVTDETTIPCAISVGAYAETLEYTDSEGNFHDYTDGFTKGDIASWSSYATPEASPDGKQYPTICAPGVRVIAGVNHFNDGDYGFFGEYSYGLIVNNPDNPYGADDGTSMATPVVSGIIALWLQAAKDVGVDLTPADVKEILRITARQDEFTTGPNASHFGYGKIDALAGIAYILKTWGDGTGLADDPYVISNTGSLDMLARRVNDGEGFSGKYFTVDRDIAYSHTDGWNSMSNTTNYTAIGTADSPFLGHFLGQGHTVSGIRIGNGGNYQGLFGHVGGTVSNVTLADAVIKGNGYVGGIAGRNSGAIEDCLVLGTTLTAKGAYSGAIAGFNDCSNDSYSAILSRNYYSDCILTNSHGTTQSADIGVGNQPGQSSASRTDMCSDVTIMTIGGTTYFDGAVPVGTRYDERALAGGIVTGIADINNNPASPSDGWYSLDGRKHAVSSSLKKGVYIHRGKKIIY